MSSPSLPVIAPGVVVVAADVVEARRGRVTVEIDGGTCELTVAPARPGQAAYLRVGEVAISHGSAVGDLGPRAAAALARYLEGGGELWGLRPASVALPSDRNAALAQLRAAPPGSTVEVAFDPSRSIAAQLPDWQALWEAGRLRKVGLTGLPLCLGGAPAAPPVEAPVGACAGCFDAARCARPPGPWVEADQGELRPRRSDDALVDLLAIFGALGDVEPVVLRALAVLRERAAALAVEPTYELSFKIAAGEVCEGPRVTCYQDGPRAELAVATFVELAQLAGAKAAADRLGAQLLAAARGLPVHVGFAARAGRIAAKAYVTTSALPPTERAARNRALLACAGERSGIEEVARRQLYCVGLSLHGDAPARVRGYEVERRRHDDAVADPWGGAAWELDANGAPKVVSRFEHFERTQLTFADVGLRLDLPERTMTRLARALARSRARVYFAFLGRGATGDGFYCHVGPRPRPLVPAPGVGRLPLEGAP